MRSYYSRGNRDPAPCVPGSDHQECRQGAEARRQDAHGDGYRYRGDHHGRTRRAEAATLQGAHAVSLSQQRDPPPVHARVPRRVQR